MRATRCAKHLSFNIYNLNSSFRGKTGPGDPAAHKPICLPLLPSGPGGVHRSLLHRAQPLRFALGATGTFRLSTNQAVPRQGPTGHGD